MSYELSFTYHKIDERAACEFLGIDYDEMIRYREERKSFDPEVLAALDAINREAQRAMIGGPPQSGVDFSSEPT